MFEINLIKHQFYILATLYFIIETAGIYFAFHAVLNSRTSQAAIAWAITLVTVPVVVLPLYWMFGSSRFYGYLEKFHEATQEHLEIAKIALSQMEPYHVKDMQALEDISNTIKHLNIIPFTSQNSAKLLINGQKTYQAMLQAIEEAQDYVLLQFYIIHNDHVGETFRKLLSRKMQQGVRVYFLYDEVGSHRLSYHYIKELKQAGAQVSSFNGHKGLRKYLHINFRNHRKIIVVDGLKAFVGGLNLGREYLGEDETMGFWRDTHVMLEGPSVQTSQVAFVKDWYWSVGEVPQLNWSIQSAEHNARQNIMVLHTGPADIKPVCSLFFCTLINHAKDRLWIATPYFVPDVEIIQALKNAALRGVDVRLILPEKYDHFYVYMASYAYYKELQGYNIKIYRYTRGFCHQKVILVDDVLAGVGTVNLDNRSIYLNFEVAAYVADKNFAHEVCTMLEEDMSSSYLEALETIDTKPFWFRAGSRLFYLLSPIL